MDTMDGVSGGLQQNCTPGDPIVGLSSRYSLPYFIFPFIKWGCRDHLQINYLHASPCLMSGEPQNKTIRPYP